MAESELRGSYRDNGRLRSMGRVAPTTGRAGVTLVPEPVSLRPLKELVRKLSPSHPLRILLLGEPDSMPRAEFSSKIGGWLRLLPTD